MLISFMEMIKDHDPHLGAEPKYSVTIYPLGKQCAPITRSPNAWTPRQCRETTSNAFRCRLRWHRKAIKLIVSAKLGSQTDAYTVPGGRTEPRRETVKRVKCELASSATIKIKYALKKMREAQTTWAKPALGLFGEMCERALARLMGRLIGYRARTQQPLHLFASCNDSCLPRTE